MARTYQLIAWLLLALLRDVTALWPLPQSLSTGSTPLRLSTSFSIKYAFNNVPGDLKDAVTRTKGFLTNDKLELLVPDRGASHATAIKKAKQLSSLTLSITGKGAIQSISQEAIVDLTERQESYTLNIPNDGSGATLSASSTLGLLRGLTTFSQLWYSLSGSTYTLEAPIKIEDAPAYPYRGFMLDTARNYFPVQSILDTLDSLAATKINTFHWHIVDSQSFPLKLDAFPELSTAGAYNPSSIYTESDVKNIVSYAAARGIDVMVEIDTPGHTASIADSHPDFIACNNLQPWSQFANEPPAGQLRFTDKSVISFVQSLFKATAELFPSTLFSTGGDEINTNCYDQDNVTQQDLASNGQTFEQALSNFTVQTHSVLENLKKTPVVWEEMVLAHNVTLSPKTIALVWISSQDVSSVTQKGYRVIHAASDFFYLDCGGGGWVGDNVDGNSWCDPFKTWQKAYSFDPLANITESEQHLILGGEQLLWTEQSGPQNLDPIVWPRAAASAEVFWSGGGGNVTAALPRLHDFRYRLVQRGVNAINLQPQWCALRPNACDLPPIFETVVPDLNNTDDKPNNLNEEIHIETEAEKKQEEPFSVYLQNHIRKRIEDFFGFSPWPNGMPAGDDKIVFHEEVGHQIKDHNDEEIIILEKTENHIETETEIKRQEEPFSVYFQNHIRKRIEDFFGFSTWPNGMHVADDKIVSDEEMEHQIKDHNDEESIISEKTNDEDQQRSLKSKEEPFGVFLQNHVKKRMADYFGPVVPKREENEL